MDPKKLSIRLSAKGKKEEKAGKEDRRLAPMMRALKAIHSVGAVSYTHLDVYKRQKSSRSCGAGSTGGRVRVLCSDIKKASF